MSTELARLEKKLDQVLRFVKRKPMWVKASVITRLTGWNKEQMRTARENGYVEYEKREDGIFYDLNTLHEKFIK